MEYELASGLVGAPVILALIEVVKRSWPSFDIQRFGALLSLVFGVVIAVGYAIAQDGDIFRGVALGVLMGLSASGLYSGAHSAYQVQKAEKIIVPESAMEDSDVR